MGRALGVANSTADIDGGVIKGATVSNCTITNDVTGNLTGNVTGGITGAAITCTNLTATGNVALGDATSDTIGLYGTSPIAQRANAAQATSLVGTASSSAVDTNLKAALIEVMNALALIGLWKGAA